MASPLAFPLDFPPPPTYPLVQTFLKWIDYSRETTDYSRGIIWFRRWVTFGWAVGGGGGDVVFWLAPLRLWMAWRGRLAKKHKEDRNFQASLLKFFVIEDSFCFGPHKLCDWLQLELIPFSMLLHVTPCETAAHSLVFTGFMCHLL